jgi:hypothetical protein
VLHAQALNRAPEQADPGPAVMERTQSFEKRDKQGIEFSTSSQQPYFQSSRE